VGSMTAGIVSEVGRSTRDRRRGRLGILGRGSYENFIQTDAAINPGNSGGPLVDLTGRVVGINTAIASRSGGFDGIGFAIPTSMARPIFEQLRETGRVRRGWLGVQIDLAPIDGALIRSVFANTPAADALEAGDVVTSVDGTTIFDDEDLRNRIAALPPGTTVRLGVVRADEPIEVEVTLGELPTDMLSFDAPAVRPEGLTPDDLGMAVIDADAEQLEALGFTPAENGVIIAAVRTGGPAFRAAVRPGERITAVNATPVETTVDLLLALAGATAAAPIDLTVATPTSERIATIQP
ncbi:MAG: PDZ domain-containing protein, partial [Planctomycetota bacterium]